MLGKKTIIFSTILNLISLYYAFESYHNADTNSLIFALALWIYTGNVITACFNRR